MSNIAEAGYIYLPGAFLFLAFLPHIYHLELSTLLKDFARHNWHLYQYGPSICICLHSPQRPRLTSYDKDDLSLLGFTIVIVYTIGLLNYIDKLTEREASNTRVF